MAIEAEALDLPFEEAIAFLRQKVNVPTRHWRQVWGAAHSHSFMVAGAATDAIVADFRAEIDKALAEGTTLADFRKGFDDIVKRHGWKHTGTAGWRSRVIFETNLRSAYAAGRYHQMTLPETTEAFPYWQYNHSGAVHPREAHQALDGNIYRWDDEIWHVIYPPNGFGCGCFVTPVSGPDLRRLGRDGPDTAPDLRLPGGGWRGVDPGFDWNPGQRWLSGGRPGQPIATDDQVNLFARRALDGELPAKTTIPVADVPERLATPLGLPDRSALRLSVDTLRDHLPVRDVTALDYARQGRRAMEPGALKWSDDGRLSAIIRIGGVDYRAGFKITAYGEFLMTTLHRANRRQVRRIEGQPSVGE